MYLEVVANCGKYAHVPRLTKCQEQGLPVVSPSFKHAWVGNLPSAQNSLLIANYKPQISPAILASFSIGILMRRPCRDGRHPPCNHLRLPLPGAERLRDDAHRRVSGFGFPRKEALLLTVAQSECKEILRSWITPGRVCLMIFPDGLPYL